MSSISLSVLDLHADDPGVHVYNLGTGRGHSVLELIKAYEEASGRKIPYEIVERRPGDVAASFADVQKAYSDLGWSTEFGLADMCAHSWKWVSGAPR